jgi:hypothetical protein
MGSASLASRRSALRRTAPDRRAPTCARTRAPTGTLTRGLAGALTVARTGALAVGAVLTACATAPQPAHDGKQGFRPLFNGRDLDGWSVVNGGPGTWTVRDGVLVCSGRPTGVMRTERTYENFVLELEYRHMVPGGNAGLFVWSDPLPARGQPFTRSIEVQVMDGVETENYTSDGDVFAIHGAVMTPDRPHPAGWMRCLPSEKRARPSPEWNRYRVTCIDGTLKLELNGAEVSGGHDIAPRRGFLCLEAEGSEVHFRDLRLCELPPSDPPPTPEQCAQADRGFRAIFDGSLAGWREQDGHAGHWSAQDWVLDYDGQGESLTTERSYGDFELIADWRWSGAAREQALPLVLPDGSVARAEGGGGRTVLVQDAGDSGIYLRGSSKAQVNIWCWPIGSGEVHGYRTDAALPAEVRAAATPRTAADLPIGQWNRFHITLTGERLTVVLNGQTVIEDAPLPGIPARGPLVLQHHGAPIQFGNLYVRETDGAQPPAVGSGRR